MDQLPALRKFSHKILILTGFLVFTQGFLAPLKADKADSLKRLLSTSSGTRKAHLLNNLAALLVEDEPGKAFSFASEALGEAQKIKSAEEEAGALKVLGDAAIEMDNYTDAIRYFQDAALITLKLSGELSDDYVNRIADIGYCFLMLSKYEQALDYFLKAVKLADQSGNLEEVANNYSNIGTIYVEWGDYGKAVESFRKAMKIDQQAKAVDKISTDMNNIGKMYELWGKFEQAVDYYRQALELELKTGKKARIAVRLNNLGSAYKAWGKYDEALDFFQQALSIERSLGDLEKVGKRFHHIGLTYFAMGQYEKCKTYLDQSLSVFSKMELHDEMARLENSYGLYYKATGNYRESITHLEKSRDLALENNLKPLLISNYQALSEDYEKIGMPGRSLHAYKAYTTLKDSVFSKESDSKLAEFRARLENEKMHLENELLRNEADTRKKTNLLIGTGLVSFLLILLALVFILRLRARNLRQAKKISEQKSEKYRMDLELKNNELTYKAMCIVRNNEVITRMIEKMEVALYNGSSAEELNIVLQNIRGLEVDNTWKEFEVRFTQVHKAFYDRLNIEFPDLTPNEKKLCAFLRLNMTTKDIASITHQSLHSINVARTRLRRKLNLANSEENLVNFLAKL